MRPAFPAAVLALLLGGCTAAPQPEPLPVQAVVDVRFSSSLDVPMQVQAVTIAADGVVLDERVVQVPPFRSATAVLTGQGAPPWTLALALANGTLLEAPLDVAGGQRGLWVYLLPDEVRTARST